MNYIIKKTIKGNLIYKNTIILTYTINYPEIISTPYENCKKSFNRFNLMKALTLERYCKNELFSDAKKTYDYNISNNFPVMVYEVVLDYDLTYNQNNLVSLYFDEYKYTGGAHGGTIRESQNWNLINCSLIPLAYFFSYNPYYTINILKQVNKQISLIVKKEPGMYFENYCMLTLDSFRLDHYYLTSKGIVVFFQQYDIAPYSSRNTNL